MTISDDDAPPSAPPMMDEEIPIVQAVSTTPVKATAIPSFASSAPPRPPPSAAVPAGMVGKTVTTTYPDGRQVTTTEYQPAGVASSVGAPPMASTAPAAAPAASQYHQPRHDLGSRPVNNECPYCNTTGKTRAVHILGDCTWISVIMLLLCCFPFFWIPFICPSCQDVEHHCGNCGKVVGKSKAECCS